MHRIHSVYIFQIKYALPKIILVTWSAYYKHWTYFSQDQYQNSQPQDQQAKGQRESALDCIKKCVLCYVIIFNCKWFIYMVLHMITNKSCSKYCTYIWIDWILFYAVSAIFQPNNGGVYWHERFLNAKNYNTIHKNGYSLQPKSWSLTLLLILIKRRSMFMWCW